MSRRDHPTRIGLFVLGGLALLVAVVVAVAGGGLFATRERVVMHFEGSIYGLQIGAPVVFRGVRLGNVVSIGLVHDSRRSSFAIPVVAELDRSLIRQLDGEPGVPPLQSLVAQGLAAQLSMQSLLTGLLYVDLDLRAGVPRRDAAAAQPGMVEIPTVATPIQALQKQLQGLDVAKLVDDVSAVAASLRALVADPQLRALVDDLARTGAELRRLVARVDRRLDPVAGSLQGTLEQAGRSLDRWGETAERIGRSAERLGAAADRADAALAGIGPTLASVRRAAEEMALGAAALRKLAADDSPLMGNVDRAAQDLARASRAVRDLADLLERQPEALIRGRAPGLELPPPTPP